MRASERMKFDEKLQGAEAAFTFECLDFNAGDQTFRLNPEQALVLAREDSTFFMGGGFQYAVACYRQLPKLILLLLVNEHF